MASGYNDDSDSYAALQAALDGEHTLAFREEQIVRLRFGFGITGRCHSYGEIGPVFDVSGERIRQLERAALTALGFRGLHPPKPSAQQTHLPPATAATMSLALRVHREELRRALGTGGHQLPRRVVAILRARFGLDDDRPRTRDEIADGLDCSYETVRRHETEGLAALHLGYLAKVAPGARPYPTHPDTTPYFNVMRCINGMTWWRTEDETWTDGKRIGNWFEVEATYGPFTTGPRGADGRLLVQAGLIDRDPIALATITQRIEHHYNKRDRHGNRQLDHHAARQRALRELRLALSPARPPQAVIDILAVALKQPVSLIRRALPAASLHLWEVIHPYRGAEGTDGDETDFDNFADLHETLDRHPNDGSTVIYRWDWIDRSEHDGVDTFAVYGLFPRTGGLFVLRCPVTKDQEPAVLDWLRGPRILGALEALWSPVLDTTPTPHHTGDRS